MRSGCFVSLFFVQWVCDSLLTKLHERFVPSVFESITNFFLVAENPCKAIPLDFVFVIDSSRSIRSNDYEKVKTFIINLLQFLDIGHDATRVGLLQYGSVVQPEFSLNTYGSRAEVEQAVKNMEHLATGTMTGLAIQYTMETAFTEDHGARPLNMHIPRIAMIVTDGRPQDTVKEVAAEARKAGIQIFAIGVGRVDMKILKTIGSEPHSEHVHLVANFSQIESLISVFQSKLCGGSKLCEVVDHQCQHICIKVPGSYRCKCRKGFSINPDGKTCQDTCAEVDHGCEHICANLPDGHECRCRPGYELTVDGKTCNRIDYCDLGIHGCEHSCISLPESFVCRCMKGYSLNLDGKTCSKIDHCADGNHGCEQEFMSTDDSCVCKCRKGFILRPDGKTCRKIDHCADGNHGCEQEFMSTDDSCVCKCRKGFTLRPDGKTCRKTDHCADGKHGCEQESVNTENSCVCKCRGGYSLQPDGKRYTGVVSEFILYSPYGCFFELQFQNRRALEISQKSLRKTCVHQCSLGWRIKTTMHCSLTCVNKTFSSGVDVCQTLEHGCEHQCVANGSSYMCKCFEGFILAEDKRSCKSRRACIKPECHDGVMDLVFVIDGSKSLGPANFELVKQFVNSIVDSLDISRTGTHVGLIQYSTKVRTEFTLGQYVTGDSIKQAVGRMQYMGRGSRTGSALRHMFESSFSSREGGRPNTQQVTIVFTDGRSQDDVSEWASKAKSSGITIYALGIGKAIEQELREIASEPNEMYLYYAESFEKMGEITQKLKSRMCKGLRQKFIQTFLTRPHLDMEGDERKSGHETRSCAFFSSTDKPADESMCQCENMITFQNHVTEKLNNLVQKNILFAPIWLCCISSVWVKVSSDSFVFDNPHASVSHKEA
uniref:Matrilin 2 n=1 Tax=Oryzias latipes TaxID=8090 RepID=A0A3P9HVM7_ORYLA